MLPYQPKNSEAPWWLSPTSDNPGYRHGKVIFTRDLLRPQQLFVGLYIEKGVGTAGAAIYTESKRGRRLIMEGPWRTGPEWVWPAFLAAMASGELDTTARAAEAQAREPLVVTVDASHVPVPLGPGDSIDVHSLSFPRDVVVFLHTAGALNVSEAVHPAGLLQSVVGANSLQALGAVIQALPDLDSFWIDVAIGLRFGTVTSTTRAVDGLWDARSVWTRAVAPWRAWLR
jgi:hypothetical protein